MIKVDTEYHNNIALVNQRFHIIRVIPACVRNGVSVGKRYRRFEYWTVKSPKGNTKNNLGTLAHRILGSYRRQSTFGRGLNNQLITPGKVTNKGVSLYLSSSLDSLQKSKSLPCCNIQCVNTYSI